MRPWANGLGCVVDRGEITLLTSIFFRCRGATALTDAAGPICLASVASVLSAIVAGAMWHPAPIRSAVEGFLTIGILPLGLLFAARTTDSVAVPRSWRWIAAAALV